MVTKKPNFQVLITVFPANFGINQVANWIFELPDIASAVSVHPSELAAALPSSTRHFCVGVLSTDGGPDDDGLGPGDVGPASGIVHFEGNGARLQPPTAF